MKFVAIISFAAIIRRIFMVGKKEIFVKIIFKQTKKIVNMSMWKTL